MKSYNLKLKNNHLFPFMVNILEAITLDTSAISFKSHSRSPGFPLLVSLNNASHTLDSFADFREWVKKLIKSLFELAEFAST